MARLKRKRNYVPRRMSSLRRSLGQEIKSVTIPFDLKFVTPLAGNIVNSSFVICLAPALVKANNEFVDSNHITRPTLGSPASSFMTYVNASNYSVPDQYGIPTQG